MARKPFTPEEVRYIVEHLKDPAVFNDMTTGWPALHWTAQHLSQCIEREVVRFRIGKRETNKSKHFPATVKHVVHLNKALLGGHRL